MHPFAPIVLTALLFLSLIPQSAHAQSTTPRDYRGSYTCIQGRTELDLKILPNPSHPNHPQAIFTFWPPHIGSAQHPEGAFLMHGTLNPLLGTLNLRPTRWIKQPPLFAMVAMTGTSNDGGAIFTGTINYPACTHFSLRLQAP
ncbi:MAG TPA: hypothetical protein PK677_10145 [Acidiphilium sp.]|nr:MAG: hypothetical protein B7Z67_11800 [Acidiphilium sp. 21-60-14]OYV90146.1 MAG: hypothetical protein B7Z57_09940 [Acidiphilium sp. 37-60-79]OZB41345.1 MAG: hypothetical protein B7X48_01585 [Acidiphilium sp. 34-60-192]HQT88895.1 hypothetical protein [Acidiphilium sp.]HQU24971.1 hypothetical protein [Acidiphilium sp.]